MTLQDMVDQYERGLVGFDVGRTLTADPPGFAQPFN